MDNAQTDKLVIEQRHREAADAWKRDWQNCRGEHTALVQAFARFERDHMAHHEAEIAADVSAHPAGDVALREALERIKNTHGPRSGQSARSIATMALATPAAPTTDAAALRPRQEKQDG